jgi:hypothetical protein
MIDLRNCVFGFKCTADWDAMKITSDVNIRHCSECKKDVYQVATQEELFEAIQLNRCVAIFDNPIKLEFVGKMIDYEDDGIKLSRPTLGTPKVVKDKPKNQDLEDYDIPHFLIGKVDGTR